MVKESDLNICPVKKTESWCKQRKSLTHYTVAYNHTNHTQKRQIDRKKIVKIEIESKLD
jgi:hypothetical protein